MLLSLLLTSALAATSPVRDAPPTTVTLDTVAVVSRSGAAPAAARPTRYCIVEALTGTRIRTKVCHTADEWIASEGEVPTGRITRR
ncbi:hypothetical protein [Sphingomonas sanguinis]|uniref:Uncharacterized protein n=1 Tax=Sphingomonas sanguinis TaxID=33051 RepID=A0A147HSI3_9SPHN|nr:hypothetical protein [Sphingomonas sanguinis]KTT67764.1 hypothetical protein NS319_16965 [Sphingomonas sanguinis]